MSILRAIAEHYAAQSNLIVPPEKFTEGQRSQHDDVPAIVYGLASETEELHQGGSGISDFTVQMDAYGETPAQADRIRDQLRGIFHTHVGPMGTDNAVDVKLCRLDSSNDASTYPDDGGAEFVHAATLYFSFRFTRPAPAPP